MNDLMDDLAEEKEEIWRRQCKFLPIIIIAVLLIATVVMGKLFFSARNERIALQGELEDQKELVQALLAKSERDNDEDGIIQDDAPLITTEMVNEQISTVHELLTSKYYYTTAGQYETNKSATIASWNIDVPLTKKSFLVTYDGVIHAGIELDNIDVQVDEENRSITVTLPASKIISHETFEDSLMVLNESDGLFNKITIDDYTDYVSAQKAKVEQQAINNNLLVDADKEAKNVIQSSLAVLPGIDSYTLVVQ